MPSGVLCALSVTKQLIEFTYQLKQQCSAGAALIQYRSKHIQLMNKGDKTMSKLNRILSVVGVSILAVICVIATIAATV